jgi:DNA-directed RNA polymerase specialized sigma24 family protein
MQSLVTSRGAEEWSSRKQRKPDRNAELQRGNRRFLTTRWSLVRRAAERDAQASAELCRAYWGPIHAFFCAQSRVTRDKADDLTQGLLATLLRDFGKVDRTKGRFRSWIRQCAKNYWYNVIDYESRRPKAYELDSAEHSLNAGAGNPLTRSGFETAEVRTPEQLFDQRWAIAVVRSALERLRQHYTARGQRALFDSLENTLSGEGRECSDAELSEQLGKSEGFLRVERCLMKKDMRIRYRMYLRAEIYKTVAAPDAIDAELNELLSALA